MSDDNKKSNFIKMNMEKQDEWLVHCMSNMTKVLMNCNREKDNCACTVQVSYIDDESIPEASRYKTSLYCAKKGNEFHEQSVKALEKVNNSVDVLK